MRKRVPGGADFPGLQRSCFGYGGWCFFEGRDEAVAATRQGLYEARAFRGIVERFAEPHDGGVQAVIEVHEGITGPKVALQLFASDHFTAAFQKESEDLTGLFLELDADAMLAELPGAEVELKNAEAHRVDRQRGLVHVAIRGDVGEYSPSPRGSSKKRDCYQRF